MSKRGMDIQGGADRYGGPDGSDTPMDTPRQATAAQMARRKIATIKKPSRATSPNKTTAPAFGGFGQQQPTMNSQPAQGGFSFGQNGTNSASTSNGISFGQSQPAVNGFNFGQSQPSTSSSFTFGQQAAAPNGGFNFNASSSVSFPPTASGTNPFASTNGQQTGSGGGFSGSIFKIPGSTSSSQETQPISNGFSFSSNNASTAPSSPAQSFNSTEVDKKEVEQREPYLNSKQQKKVEEIVGSNLPDSPASYQKDPLDLLPQEVLSSIAQYLRSLPSPSPSDPKNVTSLFVKPYRAKTKRPWVTDSERNELKSAAPSLAAEQQEKLFRIVKDSVEPLRFKSNAEFPSLEYLPNDVQRDMLDFVRKPSEQQTSTSSKPTNIFGLSGNPASESTSKSTTDTPPDEQPKSNPFASIKSASSSPAPNQAKPPSTFSFTPSKSANPAQSALPSFSFTKSTSTAAAPPTSTTEAETESQATAPGTPAKPNPFSAVARSVAPSPSHVTASETGANDKSAAGANSSASASSPFKFQSSTEIGSSSHAAATPVKSVFNFGQQVKTPAPASKNIFGNSTDPAPPATAPVQRSMFDTSNHGVPSKPSFSMPESKPTATKPSRSTTQESRVPIPSTYVPEASDDLVTLVAKTGVLNACFRGFIKNLPTYTDWSPPVMFYMQELQKLKDAIRIQEQVVEREGGKIASQAVPQPSTGQPPAPRELLPASTGKRPTENAFDGANGRAEDSPAKRQKATPGFQLPSPSKPLSNTASIFDNILSSPDKQSAAPSPQRSPPKSTTEPATSSPFKFQSTTSDNQFKAAQPSTPSSSFQFQPKSLPQPAAASNPKPVFEVPKFGNAVQGSQTSGLPKFGSGSGTSFLSSFGAKAAKEAEKEKKKRKDEDFDSDEDDEAEWERKDREKQEEKARQLAEQAKKVMKNINGKFVWVDKDEGTEVTPPPSEKPQSNGAPSGGSIFESPAKSSPAPAASTSIFGAVGKPAAVQKTNGQMALPSASQEGANDGDDEGTDDDVGAPSPEKETVPATPAKSGGLFDRVDKNADGTLQRDPQTASKPLFSFSTTSPASQTLYKPGTPIKFNSQTETPGSTTPTGSPAKTVFNFGTPSAASGPPKINFGGVFNSEPAKPADAPKLFSFGSATNGTSQPAQPSTTGVGFNFGASKTPSLFSTPLPGSSTPSIFSSAPVSRATTPGATTADETSAAGTDNEDEAAPAEEQRDLTSLSAEEARTEEVLFESKSRCRKFVRGAENPWENKGIGIVRLLKNKETANHRVLMRLSPGGQIVINANLMKDKEVYGLQGDKMVKLVFAEKEGELSTYILAFGSKESAADLVGKIKGAA
ncbi:Nucleoporin nup61 [Sphaceloma murrayae]|uniref:Nucleoporin nup61 n=1 Tax=Sphaceloma murrayae TaxID=2082308 RepID=A0A2K1R2V7_9PEZI|nr:Nucleoporin nup61 [Sphaceloma murrayae]